MISLSFLYATFGKIGDFFFLKAEREEALLTGRHRIGVLWHSLKTHGIGVAQMGHIPRIHFDLTH